MKNYIEVEYREPYNQADFVRKWYAFKEPRGSFDPPINGAGASNEWIIGIDRLLVSRVEHIEGLRKLLDAIEAEMTKEQSA